MADITCEVVKDLLPLYVDGILSEDSRILVEEHLAVCPSCQLYYGKLTNTAVPMAGHYVQTEEAAIRRIRKKINKKRILAVCLTAVIVAAAAAGLFYGIMLREKYIPYENAGLHIEDGALYTKEPFYCFYEFDSPEEGTSFVYMTTTVYESSKSRIEQGEETLIEMFLQNPPPPNDDGSFDFIPNPEIRRIYYLPQEYVTRLQQGYWVSAESEAGYKENNQERLKEIKEHSVLVWEAE